VTDKQVFSDNQRYLKRCQFLCSFHEILKEPLGYFWLFSVVMTVFLLLLGGWSDSSVRHDPSGGVWYTAPCQGTRRYARMSTDIRVYLTPTTSKLKTGDNPVRLRDDEGKGKCDKRPRERIKLRWKSDGLHKANSQGILRRDHVTCMIFMPRHHIARACVARMFFSSLSSSSILNHPE
jgi:hypothetical protein